MRRFTLVAIVAIALVLSGCVRTPGPGTPAVPVPSQVRVLQAIGIASSATEGTAVVINQLCAPPPQIDASTCATAASYTRLAARTLKEMNSEAKSTNTWEIMRIKLAGIAAKATVSATVTNPAIQIQIAIIQTAILTILGVN